MLKRRIIKATEEMAKYFVKNGTKESIPVFMYRVKKPKGIEEHIQRLDTKNRKG